MDVAKDNMDLGVVIKVVGQVAAERTISRWKRWKRIDYGDEIVCKCEQRFGESLYLAPEMYRNGQYSRSVDWWSVGMIISEMLLGYVSIKMVLLPTYLPATRQLVTWTHLH
ncbi:hypothetical protein GDO86_010843 [Hymenochirus boettgeri]|uniref:Protein kinase domain-containing protein n=1 Tax=Hymenochirus boettgeri TaxID=247094 RepID=A0A8T2J990_9PIPI|nr:hypothetical protein GDO86_010843 [Hymenochirus boettgeri]